MDATQLCEDILRTFPAGEPPFIERFDDEDEYCQCRNFVSTRRWSDIDPTEIVKWFDCLPYLNGDEIRYYLPAWLRATALFPAENVWEWTMFHLVRAESRIKEYTIPQVQCINKFLRFCLDSEPTHEDCEDALQLWTEFLAAREAE